MRRFFETIPAMLAWLTLILMFLLSRFLPVWISVFIILFDIYWLLKTIFLSFHLRATFTEMKRNMKIDWMAKLEERQVAEKGNDWRDIYHLVILPMYNEPYEVVRESFARLATAHYPKEKMIVVLALEGAGGRRGAGNRGAHQAEFKDIFYRVPCDGSIRKICRHEIPGKGSNESWAGAQAKEEIVDPMKIPVRPYLGFRVRYRYAGLPGIFQPPYLCISYHAGSAPRNLPASADLHEQHL